MGSSGWRASLLLAVPLALITAQPSFAQSDRSDPWEKMNRGFFRVQMGFDRALIGPLAKSLGRTPSPVRMGLRNVIRNLNEPLVAVNDLLQGRVGTAASTVGRFAINSIFGVAGVMDVAKRGGIPHHDNGFGTTLGRWGVGPGPYLFLPLLGPSTVRDSAGGLADLGLNPLSYAQYANKRTIGISTAVVDGLLERVDASRDLAVVEQTSTDPYATIRSFYLQNRQHEITGKEPELESLPEIDSAESPAAPPSPELAAPDSAAPPAPEPTPEPTPEPAEPKGGLDACAMGGLAP
jgi:phospholipid-binding lipoprotein MlaA